MDQNKLFKEDDSEMGLSDRVWRSIVIVLILIIIILLCLVWK